MKLQKEVKYDCPDFKWSRGILLFIELRVL